MISKSLMKLVFDVRSAIYIAGIIACIGLAITSEVKPQAQVIDPPKEFWPPDFIPHPTLPGDDPSGPPAPEWA